MLEPGQAGGIRFQQVQVTGRYCGREGQGPRAGAGRQPVPGRAQLSQRRSLTFIPKAMGGSELGSDWIKVVLMEDQSG